MKPNLMNALSVVLLAGMAPVVLGAVATETPDLDRDARIETMRTGYLRLQELRRLQLQDPGWEGRRFSLPSGPGPNPQVQFEERFGASIVGGESLIPFSILGPPAPPATDLPGLVDSWRAVMIGDGEVVGAGPLMGLGVQGSVVEDALSDFEAMVSSAEPTVGYRPVGALFAGESVESSELICGGSLVRCDRFLTAGHCLDNLKSSTKFWVYFQHSGFHQVTATDRFCSPGDAGCDKSGDMALLSLSPSVSGIRPYDLVTTKPAEGTDAEIVGFGVSHYSGADMGLKRVGYVKVNHQCGDEALCFHVNETRPQSHCVLDSGSPMLVNESASSRIAGIARNGSIWCTGKGTYVNLRNQAYASWLADGLSGGNCTAQPERKELLNLKGQLDEGSPLFVILDFDGSETGVQINLNYEWAPLDFSYYGSNQFRGWTMPQPFGCAETAAGAQSCESPSSPVASPSYYALVPLEGYGWFQLVVTADGT